MATQGRPISESGAQTVAQRKAAQRARDRAGLWAVGGLLDGLTTTALVECLPSLIAERSVGTLGAVLKEIGRRGGLTVTARPAPFGPGDRIKM